MMVIRQILILSEKTMCSAPLMDSHYSDMTHDIVYNNANVKENCWKVEP